MGRGKGGRKGNSGGVSDGRDEQRDAFDRGRGGGGGNGEERHQAKLSDPAPTFTLAKSRIRTYHTSYSTFLDLVDDPLPTDWQGRQRLRLRQEAEVSAHHFFTRMAASKVSFDLLHPISTSPNQAVPGS